jgi:hypothetical protein
MLQIFGGPACKSKAAGRSAAYILSRIFVAHPLWLIMKNERPTVYNTKELPTIIIEKYPLKKILTSFDNLLSKLKE